MLLIFNKCKSRIFIALLTLTFLTACGGSETDIIDTPDTIAPIITLNGDSSIALFINETYDELGANATDERDGIVDVTIDGSVDNSTLGNYTITYSASDEAGNNSSITRIISVVLPPDTTPPVITLNGENSITLLLNDTYTELGASAIDDRDGTVEVIITGSVDTSILGSYTITYSAIDKAGNNSSITRIISVVLPPDTTPPVITLNGENSITLLLNDTYTELGASAIDDRDGTVEIIITGSVDTSILGSYTITYSAIDKAGNNVNITRAIEVISPKPFITTWKTDYPGDGRLLASNNYQIKISTRGSGYDYQIDWGDGTVNDHVTGDLTHTYSVKGTYTVKISGVFPQLYFSKPVYDEGLGTYFSDDSLKLRSIEQWGTNKWSSMHRTFANCENFSYNATDTPDLTEVTDMSEMFSYSNFNQEITNWNVSNVTNMERMFWKTPFNKDISIWDVSNVTNMKGMFQDAKYFNQDLSNWSVSNVIDMSILFGGAEAFNQNLSSWDVSNVTNMWGMFSEAITFNQDLSSWNVSNVTDMRRVFNNAVVFNQDISSWDVSNVTNMSWMFDRASAFNQDLSHWDVSKATSMREMFSDAIAFNQDLSSWNVSNVTNMSWMFDRASAFDQDISSWNVSNVTDMTGMFGGISLSTVNYDAVLSGWSALSLQNGVFFDGGNSKYSISAQGYRDVFTIKFSWIITDGGVD